MVLIEEEGKIHQRARGSEQVFRSHGKRPLSWRGDDCRALRQAYGGRNLLPSMSVWLPSKEPVLRSLTGYDLVSLKFFRKKLREMSLRRLAIWDQPMLRVVLDTNIFVSSLLSKTGNSGFRIGEALEMALGWGKTRGALWMGESTLFSKG